MAYHGGCIPKAQYWALYNKTKDSTLNIDNRELRNENTELNQTVSELQQTVSELNQSIAELHQTISELETMNVSPLLNPLLNTNQPQIQPEISFVRGSTINTRDY